MIKPKMDLGKALATMGFGTARLDDAHGKRDAQEDLNTALTRLMEAHEKKKKKVYDTEKIEQRREMMLNKCRDEVRTIHEAYQFLSRKYQLDKERLKEKEKEMERVRETMKAEGDIEDENERKNKSKWGVCNQPWLLNQQQMHSKARLIIPPQPKKIPTTRIRKKLRKLSLIQWKKIIMMPFLLIMP